MSIELSLQNDLQLPAPSVEDIRLWVDAALAGGGRLGDSELSLRISDTDEITDLNLRYRNKAGPTNVLSLPADLPDGLEHPILGDIIVCAAIVEREAQEQGKDQQAHWAHMVIHGVLHLLGYDHIEHNDAEEMEQLEVRLLADLGFPDPYQTNQ